MSDFKIVSDAWYEIMEARRAGKTIVSFNGIGFDLPVLMHRALYNDVYVTPQLYSDLTRKWNNSNHFDLMQCLADWDSRKWKKLDFYLRRFGIGSKDGVCGADVYPMFQAGKVDEIAAYCSNDVEQTAKLYDIVRHWYGGGDKYLAFDIETIPCQDLPDEVVPMFNPKEVKLGNLKDEEKIRQKLKESEDEFYANRNKAMSCDPDLCEIVVACFYDSETRLMQVLKGE